MPGFDFSTGVGGKFWEAQDDFSVSVPQSDHTEPVSKIWLYLSQTLLLETTWTLQKGK